MKRLLYLPIIICILFSSCTSMHEVDDYAYMIALGVDTNNEGKLLLTYSFANSLSIGGSSGSGENGESSSDSSLLNISLLADDVFEGIDMLNKSLSKSVEMSHLKLIVFSKEIAKSGLKDYLNDFMLDMSVRPRIIMAISDVPPKDYLDNLKMSFEVNPEKYLNDIFKDNTSSLVTKCTMNEFYNNINSSNIVPLVTVNTKEEKSLISGMCVFKKDRLKEIYTDTDIVCHKVLNGKLKTTNYTITQNNSTISYELNQDTPPKIKVITNDNGPYINITIPIDCKIKSHSANDLIPDKALENDLETKLRQYLHKSSKTLNTDIEHFEKYAKRSFLTLNDFDEYRWSEKYKNATFNIVIDAKIQTE